MTELLAIRRSDEAGWSAAERFDGRLRLIFGILLGVFPVFVAYALIQGSTITFIALHTLMWAATGALYLWGRARSSVFFFATHPFWMYSFTLFAYSIIRLHPPEPGLYAPVRSTLVCVAALAGSSAGYLIWRCCLGLPRHRELPTRATLSSWAIGFLLIAGCAAMMIPLVVSGGFYEALSEALKPMAFLAVLLLSLRDGRIRPFSPIFQLFLAACILASIAQNERALLFQCALCVVILYLGFARRPVAVPKLAGFYLGFNAIAAFSNVMIYARIYFGTYNFEKIIPFVVERIASIDFVLACLGITRAGSFTSAVPLDAQQNYILRIFGSQLGIFERLTLLPFMDIVVARLPETVPVNWNAIENVLISALPDFGQEKFLIFSDRLSWDLGLRPEGVIGYPLVTASGEFYAMGGALITFVGIAVAIFAILTLYRVSQQVFRDDFISDALLLILCANVVFSSSALSVAGLPLRAYPLTILAYALITRVLKEQREPIWRGRSPAHATRGIALQPRPIVRG